MPVLFDMPLRLQHPLRPSAGGSDCLDVTPRKSVVHQPNLYHSTTWQGILKRGDRKLGVRSAEALLQRPLEELYDVEKDPNETRNLAGEAGYAKTLDLLRKKVRAMQERTKDPWLVKYQYE
jgi:hypothetical protein